MKKLGLVMPIMTIFLLASCGSAPTTKYTLIATCNNGTISGNKGQYEEGEDVALTFMADQGYYLPESKSNVICTGVDKSSITYISESGHLTFKMPSSPVSVTITAIEEDLWYLDEKYISNLNEDNIGTTRNLRVNGINHIVRLIGIDHDDLADGSGKAHTTWEFANLLSDSDGYSLAAVWNWEKGTSSINQNYLDSNLREVFDGGGKGGLYWYRKKQETSEQTQQTEYANKTVFDMLPSNLQNVIKEVKKPVATTSD
ncbi:MAG: hypothetical protein MJ208_04260, partial [Bacilli bacterium]|nr:hypothetical protein [Bacilli bacterium]